MRLMSETFEGPYDFRSRMGDGKGTSPEELLGAAHAGCFSMALAALLEKQGIRGVRIRTTAKVHLGFTAVGPPGPPPHPNVRFYVHAEDAQGNMVSRPGGSRPTITVTPGDVFLQWLTPSMGAYGEYYADGVKVTPGASGFDTVTASGGGVPDASAQVVIPK